MISLFAVVFALLSGPRLAPIGACDEQGFPVASVTACRVSCSWWDSRAQRCRDVDVEYLGTWDPRPAPGEWSSGYSMPNPPEWPAYALEKANAP